MEKDIRKENFIELKKEFYNSAIKDSKSIFCIVEKSDSDSALFSYADNSKSYIDMLYSVLKAEPKLRELFNKIIIQILSEEN